MGSKNFAGSGIKTILVLGSGIKILSKNMGSVMENYTLLRSRWFNSKYFVAMKRFDRDMCPRPRFIVRIHPEDFHSFTDQFFILFLRIEELFKSHAF